MPPLLSESADRTFGKLKVLNMNYIRHISLSAISQCTKLCSICLQGVNLEVRDICINLPTGKMLRLNKFLSIFGEIPTLIPISAIKKVYRHRLDRKNGSTLNFSYHYAGGFDSTETMAMVMLSCPPFSLAAATREWLVSSMRELRR